MEFSLLPASEPNTSKSNSENQICDSLETLFDSNLTTATEWMDDETQQIVIRDLSTDGSLGFLAMASPSSADEKESNHQLKVTENTEFASTDSLISECGEAIPDEVITPNKNQVKTPRRKLGTERNVTQQAKQLTDKELGNLSAKSLNKYLSGIPKEEAVEIRKRRRCLKNREYSQSSRCKELKRNEKLASSVSRLQNEIHRVQAELDKTQSERDFYKNQILETAYQLL